MTTIKREITYRCYDDCRPQGCPTHVATLEIQTTSQSYTFNLDGKELYFERGELEVMLKLICSIGRLDCVTLEIK